MLGYTATSLEIGDLPILSADMRATVIFSTMKQAMRTFTLKIGNWKPKPGAGWEIAYRLIRLNSFLLGMEMSLAVICALLFYTPAFFLQMLVSYLESDPAKTDKGWGWGLVFSAGLFFSNATCQISECTFLIFSASLSITFVSHWSTLVHRYYKSPSEIANPVELDFICQDPCSQGHRFFVCERS
jgi:hypothetical protein